jgi:hypothetical protein
MATRVRGSVNLVGLVYIIAGIYVAWVHGYIGFGLLRRVGSALLAIFLWVLVLLGVNLHIPG